MKWNDLTLTVFLVFFMLVTSFFGGQMFDTVFDQPWIIDETEYDVWGDFAIGGVIIELDEDGNPVNRPDEQDIFTDTLEFWIGMNTFGVDGIEALTPVWWFLEVLAVILLARAVRGVSS